MTKVRFLNDDSRAAPDGTGHVSFHEAQTGAAAGLMEILNPSPAAPESSGTPPEASSAAPPDVGEEEETFDGLTRSELNAVAVERGVSEPAALRNKDEVIAAIRAAAGADG